MIETCDRHECMPDTQQSRDEIRRLVELYGHLLGLDDWQLVLRVHSDPEDIESYASCKAMYEVKHVTLTFNLSQIAPSLLEWTVLHELLHAVLWPLSNFGDQYAKSEQEQEWLRLETERVVEHLAQLPIWKARPT